MSHHNVVIYRADNKWRVSPSPLHVQIGDEVEFHAQGTNAVIQFPIHALFDTSEIILKASNNRKEIMTVRASGEGSYPYSVLALFPDRIGGEYAEGNSSPRIIIP